MQHYLWEPGDVMQFKSITLSFSWKVVSSDGKRVKRKHPFTEKEREDLQVSALVYSLSKTMDWYWLLKVSIFCFLVPHCCRGEFARGSLSPKLGEDILCGWKVLDFFFYQKCFLPQIIPESLSRNWISVGKFCTYTVWRTFGYAIPKSQICPARGATFLLPIR